MICFLLFSESALAWMTDSICPAILSPTCHLLTLIDKGCKSQLELEEDEKDDGRGEHKPWISIISKKLRTFSLGKKSTNFQTRNHQNLC